MRNFVPLSIPNFAGNEKEYVENAIEQGWVSTGGAYIVQMEKQLAEFLHTHTVAACQSGTSAIHLSLVDSGVVPGDMVIVPTLTFIAAVNPVKYQFAEPVFMDCDNSLCMDSKKLRTFCEEECTLKEDKLIHKITGKHVKAVIVVHVFGNMADMENIMEIAEQFHLIVIEDATEALGTYYTAGRYAGKYAGTIGDYGAYSFNGNKIITTGGGGAVTARTSEMVEHLKYLSTQAKDDADYYIHNEVGYNYRMTNIQAALGVAQMEELDSFIKRKHKIYKLYQQAFEGFELGKLLEFRINTYSNQWFYALQIDNAKISCSMREIIMRLQEKGVQTRTVWGLVHKQRPYEGTIAYKVDKADFFSKCILNIPSSTQITDENVQYAADTIKSVLLELSCRHCDGGN